MGADKAETPAKSAVDTTADKVQQQKNSGHVDEAAHTLHDDFVKYAQDPKNDVSAYWKQMETKLGKDTLQDLSIVYGKENFDTINRNNRDASNPSKLNDKTIAVDQNAPGRTTIPESQFASQMDGYLRGALSSNKDWSHWVGVNNVGESQLNDRLSQIKNTDQGHVVANDLAKGLDAKDAGGNTLLSKLAGNKGYMSEMDLQRANMDVEQGRGGFSDAEKKTIAALNKASQADSSSPEGLAYTALQNKDGMITKDQTAAAQDTAKKLGLDKPAEATPAPAPGDDPAAKAKADAASLAGHLNAGDIPLKDMGMKDPKDPIQKANVDARLTELQNKGAVSWSDADKKEAEALGLMQKHWDDIAGKPGQTTIKGDQLQAYAQKNGAEFQGFKPDAAKPAEPAAPAGRQDADIVKAAQGTGQQSDFKLDPHKPLYDQVQHYLDDRDKSHAHSPKEVRQELERVAEQNKWVKTKEEAEKSTDPNDKRIRAGWDAYVQDGKVSHLDKGLNAKMQAGMKVDTSRGWDQMSDNEKKAALTTEVAKDIPGKEADISGVKLSDEQKAILNKVQPGASDKVAHLDPVQVADYLKQQGKELGGPQMDALKKASEQQKAMDDEREKAIQTRLATVWQSLQPKPAEPPA